MALLAAALVFVAVAPAPLPRVRGRLRHGHFVLTDVVDRVSDLRLYLRRPSDEADVVAQAMELAARALRAGASLLTALEAVSAELPEAGLDEVVNRVRGGLSLSGALEQWVGDVAERQTAAAMLVLGHSSGAAMASSLERAAASLRQRRALRDEIRALTAQTRASATVVALAPAGFAAIVTIVDRDATRVLFTTPVGLVSLAAGLALEGLGVWWMRRLCRGVARWA